MAIQEESNDETVLYENGCTSMTFALENILHHLA